MPSEYQSCRNTPPQHIHIHCAFNTCRSTSARESAGQDARESARQEATEASKRGCESKPPVKTVSSPVNRVCSPVQSLRARSQESLRANNHASLRANNITLLSRLPTHTTFSCLLLLSGLTCFSCMSVLHEHVWTASDGKRLQAPAALVSSLILRFFHHSSSAYVISHAA